MLVSILVAFVFAEIIGRSVSALVGYIRLKTHKKTPEEDDNLRARTYVIIIFVISLAWLIISGIANTMNGTR